MNQDLPKYDILGLSSDEIKRIENNCIENGHLSQGDDLLDHIKNNFEWSAFENFLCIVGWF